MRRKLFTLGSVLSLVLFAGTAVIWVLSFWMAEQFDYSDGERATAVVFSRGKLLITRGIASSNGPKVPPSGSHLFSFASCDPSLLFDSYIDRFNYESGPSYPPASSWRLVSRHNDAFGHTRDRVEWEGWGFVYVLGLVGYSDGLATIYARHLLLPRWSFVVAMLVLVTQPLIWMFRRRHGISDRAAGRCRYCRYNLTGNTSGVCPECGKMIVGGEEVRA